MEAEAVDGRLEEAEAKEKLTAVAPLLKVSWRNLDATSYKMHILLWVALVGTFPKLSFLSMNSRDW